MIQLDFARQISSEGIQPLSNEALTPEILRSGETPVRRFDPKSVGYFANSGHREQWTIMVNAAIISGYLKG